MCAACALCKAGMVSPPCGPAPTCSLPVLRPPCLPERAPPLLLTACLRPRVLGGEALAHDSPNQGKWNGRRGCAGGAQRGMDPPLERRGGAYADRRRSGWGDSELGLLNDCNSCDCFFTALLQYYLPWWWYHTSAEGSYMPRYASNMIMYSLYYAPY